MPCFLGALAFVEFASNDVQIISNFNEKRFARAVPIPDSLIFLFGNLLVEIGPDAKIWRFSRPTAYRLVTKCTIHAGIVQQFKNGWVMHGWKQLQFI